MELIPIYEDDNTKIEIYKKVIDVLRQNTDLVTLNSIAAEDIVKIIIKTIPKEKLEEKILSVANKVPIIHKNNLSFTLFNGFEVFNEAVLLISSAFDLSIKEFSKIEKLKLMILIDYYYELQGLGQCRCVFFENPIHNVAGFLYYISEEKVYCLPFILSEV